VLPLAYHPSAPPRIGKKPGLVHAAVTASHGTVVKHVGDGVMATFPVAGASPGASRLGVRFFQLSGLSRCPSSTAIISFVPSGRTPIITSVQRRSSSSRTWQWTPSPHTYT
jgi:hypothetical protein